jgi:hypothetical protein
MPLAVVAVHFALLAGVVTLAHHPVAFLALFLLFLGFTQAYERHQDPLILRKPCWSASSWPVWSSSADCMRWWLQPIVSGLEPLALFFGALGLTAVADNAALTYLGSLMTGITDESKYMLVAGAVAGGGLTVIANAPNPAGVALLKRGSRTSRSAQASCCWARSGRRSSPQRRSSCDGADIGPSPTIRRRTGEPVLSRRALECAHAPRAAAAAPLRQRRPSAAARPLRRGSAGTRRPVRRADGVHAGAAKGEWAGREPWSATTSSSTR